MRFAFGVTNPLYVVASESMIPVLNVGDLWKIQR
jgi:signal peptidase I